MDIKDALQQYITTCEVSLQVLVAPYGRTLWVVGTPEAPRDLVVAELYSMRYWLDGCSIRHTVVLPHILQVN